MSQKSTCMYLFLNFLNFIKTIQKNKEMYFFMKIEYMYDKIFQKIYCSKWIPKKCKHVLFWWVWIL